MKRKSHILVIRFSELGDITTMVPVIHSLAMKYPETRITVLSRPYARTYFENMASNVNFMEADLKNEYHGVKGLNALYRRLTAKQFTHIADLQSILRTDYLRLRFNLGRFRVEHIRKHHRFRSKFLRKRNRQNKPLPATTNDYQDVFDRLGFPINESA